MKVLKAPMDVHICGWTCSLCHYASLTLSNILGLITRSCHAFICWHILIMSTHEHGNDFHTNMTKPSQAKSVASHPNWWHICTFLTWPQCRILTGRVEVKKTRQCGAFPLLWTHFLLRTRLRQPQTTFGCSQRQRPHYANDVLQYELSIVLGRR